MEAKNNNNKVLESKKENQTVLESKKRKQTVLESKKKKQTVLREAGLVEFGLVKSWSCGKVLRAGLAGGWSCWRLVLLEVGLAVLLEAGCACWLVQDFGPKTMVSPL